MNALFKSISRFFRRLFGLDEPTAPSQPIVESVSSPRPALKKVSPPISREEPQASSRLQRLVYEVAYRLSQDKPTQGAQVGPIFRQVDPDFSAKRYGFAKTFDLLEAVPTLVRVEKKAPHNAAGQFIFFVRPVHDVRQLLTNAVKRYGSEAGWVHVDSVKQAITQQDTNFSVQTYGFSSFRTFIESRHDLLEFKEAGSDYVRLFPARTVVPKPAQSQSVSSEKRRDLPGQSVSSRTTATPATTPKPTKQKINIHLTSFARLGDEDLNQSVYELAAIANNEPWYFGSEPPTDFPHPILKNYIRHMFTRLQHEGKVASSQSGQFYTFHTNLYDKLRRPIYALMTQKSSEGDDAYGRPALKLEFCVSGEGIGKNLVGHFGALPPAANFMTKPERFFLSLRSRNANGELEARD